MLYNIIIYVKQLRKFSCRCANSRTLKRPPPEDLLVTFTVTVGFVVNLDVGEETSLAKGLVTGLFADL